jgi:hypothetical protein
MQKLGRMQCQIIRNDISNFQTCPHVYPLEQVVSTKDCKL